MIARKFSPFLLTAAFAASHWTVNDGQQLVDEGGWSNQMVDDEGRRSKSEGREE